TDLGYNICANYKKLEIVDNNIREQQIEQQKKCNILYYKAEDNNQDICNECYKIMKIKNIENANEFLMVDSHNMTFSSYNTIQLPDELHILKINLPYYKRIPSGIKMQLFELYNNIFK